MASGTTYSGISGVLATLFEDDVAEQLNRASVLLRVLPKKDAYSRNINIAIRATSGLVASTSIYLAPGADVSAFNTDGKVNAHGDFATVSEAFSVDNFALEAAAATGNPLALADLFREELITAAMRLGSNLNKQLYLGDGGTVASAQTIQGLIGDAGGDGYGGGWLSATNTSLFNVNQQTTTAWQSNVLANASVTRDISFGLLEAAERVVYEGSGQQVGMWLSDAKQWAKLASLFTATTTQFRDVKESGDIVYDVGANRLQYRGVPIIKDKDCPAGIMIGLTPEHISLEQMPFSLGQTSNLDHGVMELVSGSESQFGGGQVPFRVKIQELARSGDYVKFQLVAYPQLVVRRPNAQVLITDLTATYSGL